MNEHKKHWTLYVLKLEQDKWYVGITSQTPEKRFQEHLHGRKSYWTEKYPPVEIVDTVFLGDLGYEEAVSYEDKVTRRYMKEKGINNVRGGKLTQTSGLVVRFGYLFNENDWEAITVVTLLTLVIFGSLVNDLSSSLAMTILLLYMFFAFITSGVVAYNWPNLKLIRLFIISMIAPTLYFAIWGTR